MSKTEKEAVAADEVKVSGKIAPTVNPLQVEIDALKAKVAKLEAVLHAAVKTGSLDYTAVHEALK